MGGSLLLVPCIAVSCVLCFCGLGATALPHNSVRATCPCSDPSLCDPIKTTPKKEILAFSVGGPSWKQYDWDHITTVVLFGPPINELMCYAHSKGIRILQAGNFNATVLFNETLRKVWVDDAVSKATANFMDGVNLDIEYPLSPENAPILTSMVKMVADAFRKANPHAMITFDGTSMPNCMAQRCYDYKSLAEILDYILIMAYDILIQWLAMANAPLPQVIQGIDEYLQLGISPNKLVLGVPWYGYDFACESLTKNLCYTGFKTGIEINYATIMKLPENNATSGRLWSDVYKSPYFNYEQQSSGQMHQLWYDDPMSLQLRYDYAKKVGLYGVGMWTADAVDYSDNPLAKNQTKAMWAALDSFLDP